MHVSQKCQYALRAVFELAKHHGGGPVKIAAVAEAQSIPISFLESILVELKQGGFVRSRRGRSGGYLLRQAPSATVVGELIRFVEGPLTPVTCAGNDRRRACELAGRCVFLSMWEEVRDAVSGVYDRTTFADLVERERLAIEEHVPSYTI